MKKTALILFAVLLVLVPTFRASAYDTADGHAVMDFATEVTAGEQKVNEAMLITSNTIGGEGTIAGTRIENGELKESGTHDELIRRKGKYFELYKLQAEALQFIQE